MFKNYLRSLYRNIVRNKFYTSLNIIGLSIGIAAAVFILLYIQDELSFDKYHENHKNIYRLEADITVNNNHQKFAKIPIPIGPALKLEFPEIEEFVRIDFVGNTLFRQNNKEYYEEEFYFADSTIFKVFTHKFLYGNPATCLTQPNTIVLTEKIANKYFEENDPVGEILTTGKGNSYKITGVIENLPGNSHFKFDALISIATEAARFSTTKPSRFWRIGAYTYLLLHEKASIGHIHEKFPGFYNKYMKELGDQYNLDFNLMSTPLIKTHFRQGLGAERPSGNMAYLLIFSAVAVFILLIAAINYMNMATARSANRAKEVGVRKVLGAHKKQLIYQFISESTALSVIAMLIAIVLVWLLIPEFNSFTDKSLTFSLMKNLGVFLEIIIITLVIGFISGSYPAFYLSSFQPVKVLKGNVGKTGKKGGLLRRILVVIQFFIAIFMGIGAIIVSGQLNFLKNKDLGFEKENLIYLEMHDSAFRSKVQTFKEELLLNPDIISVTNSSGIPGRVNNIKTMKIERETGMENQAVLYLLTDYDFVETLRLKIVKGRDFDEKMGTDSHQAVIINETAVKEFGWEKEPLGKKIHYGFRQDGSGGKILKVIGVVEDFHFKSLHNAIEPVIFILSEQPQYLLSCHINREHNKESIEYLEKNWNKFNIKHPFDYKFLGNSMDDQYIADEKIGFIVKIATILTIFIALLGLLGLSSFIAEQKTKEIGVRKVLGASVGNILMLLYREFALLILIAFILAIPVAWWQLNNWLETNFTYHQDIQWTSFLIAGLSAFFIGMATISYYIIKAASFNPADTIKYE